LEILDQDMMQERVQVTGHFFKALMMRHALMTLAPIPPGVLDIMQDLTKNREHYGRHNHNDQGTSSHTNKQYYWSQFQVQCLNHRQPME
jgi:hypothetical protein